MIDRIGNTGVLGNTLVRKINLSVFIYGYVLQKGVSPDRVVDIRLGILVQVDNLCVASALVVKHAVVIPAVLVVSDQKTLRIGRKGCLSGTGQPEEHSGVLSVQVCVGRAVHGCNTLQRHKVVHHGEHTFFHFSAVPGVDDYLLFRRHIEHDCRLGIQSQFFIIGYLCLGRVVNNEIRLKVLLLLCGRLDEHVADKMCLPCNFHNKPDSHSGILIGTAESIHDIEFFVGELFLCDLLDCLPGLLGSRMIVILILVRCPPNGVPGILIHNDKFIFGRASGVNTGHNIYSAKLCNLTFLITGQTWFCLFLKQFFVGGIVHNLRGTCNAVLA